MCGRYTLITDIVDILSHFGIELYEDRGLNPQFNVAPSKEMPILTERNQLDYLKWGVNYNDNFVINVRSEGRYRRSRVWQRCLVPATGYFEWRKEGDAKQPYYFTHPGKSWFMFAGLYQEGFPSTGFTILTKEANKQVKPYHHRMPVMLSSDVDYAKWLIDNTIPKQQPSLKIYAVNKAVSNARNNSPLCVEPLIKKQMSFL